MDATAGGNVNEGAGVQESMAGQMSVTVKTLDSQNHEFTVSENMLVKDFKIEITEKVVIPADQQRLIFRGRVLQDDKKMGECNVADSTIHVVQRSANSSRSNDEPPPVSAASRMSDGIQGGLIIAGETRHDDGTLPFVGFGIPSQTGPVPSFGPRCSAAARLQASNNMLSRASAFLRQMEDRESVTVGTEPEVVVDSTSASVPRLPSDDAAGNNNMEVDDGELEINLEDGGSLSSMISQMANAATLASISGMHAPQHMNRGEAPLAANNTGSTRSTGNVTLTTGPQPPVSTGSPNAAGSPSPTARRPESPRLHEMATVIEGIVSFNNRLTPYLRFMETALRTNQQYDDVSEQQSVQYLFDTLSCIMHYMSHSYHALSDMICDFSTPANTRRLRAATAVLLETSTVLRASIPIAVPIPTGSGGMVVGGTNFPQQQLPPPNSSQPQTPAEPTGTNNINSNPQRPATTPMGNQNQHIAQAVSQQLSQMLGPNSQINFGNLGHGNFGAQIHVGIEGPEGSQGMQGINIQDLANMFGPMAGGMMQQQQPSAQNQPPITANSSGSSSHTINSSTTTNRNNGTGTPVTGQQRTAHPTSGGRYVQRGGSNNNNFRIQQGGPFDVLVPCNSHHGWRSRPATRPTAFNQYVNNNISPESVSSVTVRRSTEEFLHSALNVLLQSNILSLLRPAFQDVIANYLMRGRDIKNKEHIKSCAKKLSKSIVPFLVTFTSTCSGRDMNIDYAETYGGILSDFVVEVVHLTATLPLGEPYQYQSALVTAGDKLIGQIINVFKHCFKTHRYVQGFAEFVVETVFGSCSVMLQDEMLKTLTRYFGLHASVDSSRPIMVELKKETRPATNVTGLAAASASPSPSTSTVKSPPMSSPEVAPPKQAKQSSSPAPKHDVMEDDLDDFLGLDVSRRVNPPAAAATPIVPNFIGGGLVNNFESALRNIPTEWVDTVRHDLTRQLGMPDQPPFSPAYSGIFSRKHT